MRELPLTVPGKPPLAGTLTLPDGDGPHPAVVLASGSGPLDRDSNTRRGRFDVSRQLANALTAAGFSTLRYDKRGVGKSPGDWRAAGLDDNAADLGRAVAAVTARPDVDPARVLVAGHSEGALLAAAVAAGGAPVAGAILLSCSATPGDRLLLWQARQIAPTLPLPVRAILRLFRVDLERRVAANHAKIRKTTKDVTRMGGVRFNARWTREFLAHDPRADLRRVAVPVLAITGAKDLQVPAADLKVIADIVAGDVTVLELPDLTHTLRRQPGRPSLSLYKKELREPVDREVLDAVVTWASGVVSSP